NSVGNIRQCLDEIGVDRIDHGVNAGEDDELVAELVRRDMALTVCPISNRYVTDGTKAAQIKDLLDRGVRVTVNSDDPAYFPGYMLENLVVLQEEAGLSRKDLVRLSRNAFGAAWLDDDRKAGFLESLDAFVAAGQD
ncbi:MAG: adenosine deaminase, partial [Acidimicrobiia bacterium]|nr:adenosine deaminase [Acidimicrobiia bacterium]